MVRVNCGIFEVHTRQWFLVNVIHKGTGLHYNKIFYCRDRGLLSLQRDYFCHKLSVSLCYDVYFFLGFSLSSIKEK